MVIHMYFIKEILKGVLIGIANAIPGVSGGTMMVSMGIYDKIISAITNLLKDIKKSIIMLLPYIIGMIVGIVGLSFSIEYLFVNFPLQTSLLFIGLILGGIPVLIGHMKGKKINIANAIVFLVFFSLIIGLQILNGQGGQDVTIRLSVLEVAKLFGIGVIASATMVIPGVSGSMILMLLGYYYPVIDCVTGFIHALVDFNMGEMLRYVGILLPFGIGVILGIFVIAKIIEYLLKNQEGLTYSAILGLVVASPIAILMQISMPTVGILLIVTSILTFFVGFGIAFFLGRE